MARRRFARTRRAASAARSGYRRFRGSGVGKRFNFRKVGAGAMTNVAMRVGSKYLGQQWGPPAGAMLTGILMDDDTSQWMAGFLLGNQVPTGDFGAQAPQGGYF